MQKTLLLAVALACACSPGAVAGGPGASAPDPHPTHPGVIAVAPAPAACASAIAVNDRVICNWQGRGVYYPGRVERADANGNVAIQYDDGDREQTASARCVREPAGANVAIASAEPDPSGIAGQYRIAAAANPGGGASYTGDVQIRLGGGAYHMEWSIPGSPGYAGVALRVGDVLGVGWSVGGAPGVVVYKVDGGKLAGVWSSGAQGGVGEESLDGPPGLNGTYRITSGKNPDGSSYTGTVAIAPKGDTYALAWSIPGTSYVGVGILKRDVLAVGWGNGGPPGVVAYNVTGASLDGVWSSGADGRLGTERLERR